MQKNSNFAADVVKGDYKTEFAQADKNTFINQSESITSTFHGKQIFLSIIDNGYFFSGR